MGVLNAAFTTTEWKQYFCQLQFYSTTLYSLVIFYVLISLLNTAPAPSHLHLLRVSIFSVCLDYFSNPRYLLLIGLKMREFTIMLFNFPQIIKEWDVHTTIMYYGK